MNPLMSAEQAVLGAALLDPEQLTHLEWLAADHFYRPVHQALFAALRKLRNDGHPALSAAGPLPLSWVTDAVEEAGQHVRGLTAAYAHTLIQACPRTEHAPVYGRMVLEGAIHRTVAKHAIRLHQAARADAVQGEVEGALRTAGVLTGVLTDLARRWGTDPRPVPPTAGPSAPRTSRLPRKAARSPRTSGSSWPSSPNSRGPWARWWPGCGRETSPTRPTGSSTGAWARCTTEANPSTGSPCSGRPSDAACWPTAQCRASS